MSKPRASQGLTSSAPTTDGFTENGLPIGPNGIAMPTLPSRGGAAYRIRKRELTDTGALPGNVPTIVPVSVDGYSAARVR
jgi:hypothetical protein